jgi:hypothetical protein
MTEDQIRAVIRDVLSARAAAFQPPASSSRQHPSSVRLTMVAPTKPGSPCVIEPAVGCNQCGYCVSLGH